MAASETKTIRIAMVAGEASGDLLGSSLMKSLIARVAMGETGADSKDDGNPDPGESQDAQTPSPSPSQSTPSTPSPFKGCKIEFLGVGGPKMKAQGFKSLCDMEELSVRGLFEIATQLPRLFKLRDRLADEILAWKPDVFVGIDLPDFNFSLEKIMKKNGVPTCHYVSPSVWAWREGRADKMVKFIDEILCLFPHEPEIYLKRGGKATFVGHPLVDKIPEDPGVEVAKEEMKFYPHDFVVTVMPGSRMGEIDYMAKTFLDAALIIRREIPEAKFVIPVASAPTRAKIDELLKKSEYSPLEARIQNGHAERALAASDVVLVASGTASLETALALRPMVISYKVSGLTFRLVKSIYKLPYVGLPNILAGKFVAPEILQNDATPERLAAEVVALARDEERKKGMVDEFAKIRGSLHHEPLLAADKILGLVKS